MPEHRILGVDPGTRRVGYGIVDATPTRGRASRHRPFAYVECGVIAVPGEAEIAERLHVVARTLAEIVEEFRPTVLAIEKAFHGRNAASALKLGQARGAIMLMATQQGLSVFEYAPAQIKQQVAGHGRATKEQVQHRVQLVFDLKVAPATDAADALAIALCHGQAWGPSRVPRIETA